jgi:hypothetical protein
MAPGAVLAAGLLPEEDFSERVPPAITVYKTTDKGTLIAELDHDGWKSIIADIFSCNGLDSEEEMSLAEWATRTGLPIATLAMATSLGFLYESEARGGRVSLYTTSYATYLREQMVGPAGNKKSLAADDDDW